jgi:hypothetical protein
MTTISREEPPQRHGGHQAYEKKNYPHRCALHTTRSVYSPCCQALYQCSRRQGRLDGGSRIAHIARHVNGCGGGLEARPRGLH